MNIDWSKAPEDATHYSPGGDVYSASWIKWVNGELHGWLKSNDTSWGRLPFQEKDPDQISLHIERPKKQEAWDGEDLPPVGTVCDMHIYDFGWLTGTVVVHIDLDEPTAVAHNGEEVFHGNASDFRPIKTAEQLAEEEREDAANKMFQRFGGIGGLTKKQCIWAISEGYRKQ